MLAAGFRSQFLRIHIVTVGSCFLLTFLACRICGLGITQPPSEFL